jgi:hypothetical protein
MILLTHHFRRLTTLLGLPIVAILGDTAQPVSGQSSAAPAAEERIAALEPYRQAPAIDEQHGEES